MKPWKPLIIDKSKWCQILVKSKPYKCEFFNVSHYFIHKMCWLDCWPPKISLLLSWVISLQIGICNLSSGWLELNIFIPSNFGGWQGWWLTQWSLNPQNGYIWAQFTKVFFGILQPNDNCLLMSTFLGGWHFPALSRDFLQTIFWEILA